MLESFMTALVILIQAGLILASLVGILALSIMSALKITKEVFIERFFKGKAST